MLNLPRLSDTAVRFVPVTVTDTPDSGVPSSESTVPLMGMSCAIRLLVIMPNIINMTKLKSFRFLIVLVVLGLLLISGKCKEAFELLSCDLDREIRQKNA
jgi:hypothetical protein